MPDLELRSFQSLQRVEQLRRDQVLIGDWGHVTPGTEGPYARMVEIMAEHGIDTDGRPPMWAWRGRLRLLDAELLFDPVHELSNGFATVTFHAPEHLVLLSDYGHWCDFLMSPPGTRVDRWRTRAHVASSVHPEQACLPYVLLHWVTDIRPLPTTGWSSLDLETLL